MAGPADRDRLEAVVRAERANSRELRRSLREARAELATVRRRDAVRVALAIDARLRPLAKRLPSTGARRAWLALASLRTFGTRSHRRADLVAGVATARNQRRPAESHEGSTSVVVLGQRATVAEANRAVRSTSGDVVCIRLESSEPFRTDWDAALTDSLLTFDAAAIIPTLVHPDHGWTRATPFDMLTRARGFESEVRDAEPVLLAAGAGTSLDESPTMQEVLAGSVAGIALRRSAFEAGDGLDAFDDLDTAVVDLCLRLHDGGQRVLVDPSVHLFDHRPVGSVRELTEPFAGKAEAWTELVRRHGPKLRRSATIGDTSIAPSIAITIGAPSAKVAPRWGDWHFGHALAESLRSRGFAVALHTADTADTPAARAADVHLVVRGRAPVARTSGQRHILWIISHPEEVDLSECDEADLVLVASQPFADELSALTSTPVEVMLQATDHRRFHRRPVDPAFSHPVAIVARSRGVIRPAVADALAAGLRPALYGTGWAELVDPALVAGEYLDNDRLPLLYSSIGVLLVDHWQTMREGGFVSNRIFDALACGTPVISDAVEGIDTIFGDAVTTYEHPSELRARVDELLKDPAAARTRAASGTRMVLDHHTFDHRAAQLEDLLGRYAPLD